MRLIRNPKPDTPAAELFYLIRKPALDPSDSCRCGAMSKCPGKGCFSPVQAA